MVHSGGSKVALVTTSSDITGRYVFNSLPRQALEVSVSAVSYQSAEAIVNSFSGSSVRQDFVLAQLPTSTLAGTVSDQSGIPIAGASVTILHDSPIPALSRPVTTDSVGQYRIVDVDGPNHVAVTASGYLRVDRPVTLAANATTTANFTLQRATTFAVQAES